MLNERSEWPESQTRYIFYLQSLIHLGAVNIALGQNSMWANFKEMPILLRFITGHAIACIFLFLGSIIPHDSFSINGRPVSYAVWWSSGAGLYASILGIILPTAGYLLLKRSSRARSTYLGGLSIATVAQYFFEEQFLLAAIDMLLVGLLGWYLYGAKSVQRYFACSISLRETPDSTQT